MARLNVAIVGATGAVGRELIRTLEERRFPIQKLTLFASKRSSGMSIPFAGSTSQVLELKDTEKFSGQDLVFFTSSSAVSKMHVPRALEAGAFVIDNSSHFRMNEEVPLVVPEVNGSKIIGNKLIANPNCTTAQLVMALKPLHDEFKIKRVQVSSYQAVSGKGQKGVDEFLEQVRASVENRKITPKEFPHPIAFNCIPHIDVFSGDGFTGEENKVMAETKKILGDQNIRVGATCVRVPVLNGHSESVAIETERVISPESARAALMKMSGVKVVDDVASNQYPLAMNASHQDLVLVGRIRQDKSMEPCEKGLLFWVVADNLRKGAALNAVQIAEQIIK